jgi:hypothetical protein
MVYVMNPVSTKVVSVLLGLAIVFSFLQLDIEIQKEATRMRQ